MIQVWGVGGALKLVALIVVAIAMPLVFGTTQRGLWDCGGYRSSRWCS